MHNLMDNVISIQQYVQEYRDTPKEQIILIELKWTRIHDTEKIQ